MKDHEIYSDYKVPKGSQIILRLDGRNFHNLSRKLDLKKPYDDNFIKSMVDVGVNIFKEFSPSFIYTFSDEINILLSEIPFSGRIEKLNSVFASFASSALTLSLNNYFKDFIINNCNSNSNNDFFSIISFDSRIIPIANEEIVNYFRWRQDEAWRNCINSYGYWSLKMEFPTKIAVNKLKKLKSSDIHDLLFKKGINLNDVPNYQKRGIAIYKKKKLINGINPKTKSKESSFRKFLFIDKKLSMFDEDYFKSIDFFDKFFL